MNCPTLLLTAAITIADHWIATRTPANCENQKLIAAHSCAHLLWLTACAILAGLNEWRK